MNFERHKDVKDSIGIGAKETAKLVSMIGVYKVKSFIKKTGKRITMKVCQRLTESHGNRVLMGVASGELRPEEHGIRVFENGYLSKWGSLKHSKGKWLKYQNHFYYIPL